MRRNTTQSVFCCMQKGNIPRRTLSNDRVPYFHRFVNKYFLLMCTFFTYSLYLWRTKKAFLLPHFLKCKKACFSAPNFQDVCLAGHI